MDDSTKQAIQTVLDNHYTAEAGYEDRTAALFGLLVDVGREYQAAITPADGETDDTLGSILEDPVLTVILGLEENLRLIDDDEPEVPDTAAA